MSVVFTLGIFALLGMGLFAIALAVVGVFDAGGLLGMLFGLGTTAMGLVVSWVFAIIALGEGAPVDAPQASHVAFLGSVMSLLCTVLGLIFSSGGNSDPSNASGTPGSAGDAEH
ncbi:hypothetical protein [Kocuria rosea]|uniref:hypothetical protein n=1 Tax=Kocuria rosea TaxID=1275 RepID=UPI0011A72E73|nr:hypothetical protein [Kocuria rosea]